MSWRGVHRPLEHLESRLEPGHAVELPRNARRDLRRARAPRRRKHRRERLGINSREHRLSQECAKCIAAAHRMLRVIIHDRLHSAVSAIRVHVGHQPFPHQRIGLRRGSVRLREHDAVRRHLARRKLHVALERLALLQCFGIGGIERQRRNILQPRGLAEDAGKRLRSAREKTREMADVIEIKRARHVDSDDAERRDLGLLGWFERDSHGFAAIDRRQLLRIEDREALQWRRRRSLRAEGAPRGSEDGRDASGADHRAHRNTAPLTRNRLPRGARTAPRERPFPPA